MEAGPWVESVPEYYRKIHEDPWEIESFFLAADSRSEPWKIHKCKKELEDTNKVHPNMISAWWNM